MPGARSRLPRKRSVFARLFGLLVISGAAAGLLSIIRPPGTVSGRGHHGTPPSAKSLAEGYEVTDISARDVSMILAGMAAVVALVIGIVFLMGSRFHASNDAANATLTQQETARTVPPAPQLQRHPFDDLNRVHTRESRMLNSYGWLDANHTIARIPIKRALELSVGKSLDAAP
ncbi:MAG TPA: hypothetical protein VHO91_23875 [Rhodopila sp.]|nr:hypothetical protein [Rhodopila sp.]